MLRVRMVRSITVYGPKMYHVYSASGINGPCDRSLEKHSDECNLERLKK